MPQPNFPNFKALSEGHALPYNPRSPRSYSLQLFPVPTAAEADASAAYILKRIRKETANKTRDQQRAYVFGTLRSGVNPFTFEMIIIRCFREMGYETEIPSFKRDGGIDGAIFYNQVRILLQCKRYSGGEARYLVRHLREYIAIVTSHKQQGKAIGGFFIHTGRSGMEAEGILDAAGGLVTMFSGNTLLDLLLKPNG